MSDLEYRTIAIANGWRGLRAPLNTALVKSGTEVWRCRRKNENVWCRADFVKRSYSNHKYYRTLEDAIKEKNLYYKQKDMYKED